jgi:putative spermidine/putrescine transport system substrate-binding protein
VSYGGGAYQASHKRAFIEPYQAQTGIRVQSVVWGAEFGKLQEMVRSGAVPWDVVEVTASQFLRGSREGLFAQMTTLPDAEEFKPLPGGPTISPLGVPNVYWSTVVAFDPHAFPQVGPSTWQDFWDLTRFPGPRALYDNPRGNLEFALLADGVSPANLYPLDVTRAFRKLDELKPHVRVWWSDGTEPVQLLLSHQVVSSSAWSGRIVALGEREKEIRYSWKGAAHELDYWIVPRGSKSIDSASAFIRFASRPEEMAAQARLIGYGPANSQALNYVDAKILPHLPTAPANWALSFVINATWWAEHEQEVEAFWVRWKGQ